MNFPPKLGKEQKQQYRREKRRRKPGGQQSGSITVTIPPNSTQGVVVQPFNLFPQGQLPQLPVSSTVNRQTQQPVGSTVDRQYQQPATSTVGSTVDRQYQQPASSTLDRRYEGRQSKQKSPPLGNILPPKKKRGLESDGEKFWATIYPYKDANYMRGDY